LLAQMSRELRANFRLGGFLLLGLSAAYALALLALLLVNYSLGVRYYATTRDALEAFFFQLMAVQMVLLHLLAPARVALSIVRDGAGGTLELERMSPSPGVSMAFGRALGTMLFYGYLCLIALLFGVIVAAAGGVGWLVLARHYALLFAWGYLFLLLGVCAGSLARGLLGAVVASLIFPIGAYAFGFLSAYPKVAGLSPMRMLAAPLSLNVAAEYSLPWGSLPGLWACCCLGLYLYFWALFAAARLIKHPRKPPLSRLQTLLMLTVTFSLFALAVHGERGGPFLYLCFALILWVCGWFLMGFSRRGGVSGFWSGLVREDGPFLPFYLVVGVVLSVCVVLLFGFEGRVWLATGVLLVFALFYGLIVWLLSGWLGRGGRALAALLFLVQAVVPLGLELTRRGGWVQILNPLYVMGAPLGALKVAVDPVRLAGWGLLLYGGLTLLLAALAAAFQRTTSPAYPTT